MVSAVGVVGFASIISDAGSEACCMVGPVFKVYRELENTVLTEPW